MYKDINQDFKLSYEKKLEKIIKVKNIKEIPVTIIKLTDEMKQSVQQDGQALFSIFGIGAGAKIASDSMQNNSISKQTNKE